MSVEMRNLMNSIKQRQLVSEGVISALKDFFSNMNNPIKAEGQAMLKDFEAHLRAKYGALVSNHIQQTNKSWMWSKVTYQDIYRFLANVMHVDSKDIDKLFKNPILNNTLKQIFAALPPGSEKPNMPLKASVISNNNNPISPIVDTKTKQYLSRLMAISIFDGVAYMDHHRRDLSAQQSYYQTRPSNDDSGSSVQSRPMSATTIKPDQSSDPTNDELRAKIAKIRQGLENMKASS